MFRNGGSNNFRVHSFHKRFDRHSSKYFQRPELGAAEEMEGKSDIDVTADDRISKLPEPILQHILSFLHAKDAARMSILSRVWVSAWNSLSYLNFGDKFVSESKDIPKLLNAVDQALANRKKSKISIQKFSLKLPHHRWLSYVDSWITTLIACNTKELNLTVDRPIYQVIRKYNSLPHAIFAVKELQVLSLGGFKIDLPAGDGMIKLSSLRELHLSDVSLDEQFIQALCSSCCNLEDLSLRSIVRLTSFQVGETLPKLKKVNLEFCPYRFQLVDIAAINLEDLKIHSLYRNIEVVKITACKALKSLHLNGVDVTKNWLEKLFYSLQNLETLHLANCNNLRTTKITSDSLKWLTISCYNNLIVADFDTPNLLKFQCSCDPLSTFKLKASVLLEVTLHLYAEHGVFDWHSKLVKFLANFNYAKAIELMCDGYKEIVIPKDLRENFLPPLYGTNILQVNLEKQSSYSVVHIIDSMLWISPRPDTLSFTLPPGLKSLKFIYKDASDEDGKPCCASLPWKCWRHTLKQVKLQNFTHLEEEKLIKYFFANADNLEMVETSVLQIVHS
ncbi:hypothetical protein HAX54_026186 [Datura stramonium]|uniref:F-box domain-containing protein n=1 Tax=Datura stramonium TaxID=4076 RepID=A0ABS8V3U2_DATST|nr:hypothetical protein [Datura stramonium]